MFPGVCPCFLTTALTQPCFQWHRLLSSNASTRWEMKIRRTGSSPEPGMEITTARSWVWHAHHWATLMWDQGFGILCGVIIRKKVFRIVLHQHFQCFDYMSSSLIYILELHRRKFLTYCLMKTLWKIIKFLCYVMEFKRHSLLDFPTMLFFSFVVQNLKISLEAT